MTKLLTRGRPVTRLALPTLRCSRAHLLLGIPPRTQGRRRPYKDRFHLGRLVVCPVGYGSGSVYQAFHGTVVAMGDPGPNQRIAVSSAGQPTTTYELADHFWPATWLSRIGCGCADCTHHRAHRVAS